MLDSRISSCKNLLLSLVTYPDVHLTDHLLNLLQSLLRTIPRRQQIVCALQYRRFLFVLDRHRGHHLETSQPFSSTAATRRQPLQIDRIAQRNLIQTRPGRRIDETAQHLLGRILDGLTKEVEAWEIKMGVRVQSLGGRVEG